MSDWLPFSLICVTALVLAIIVVRDYLLPWRRLDRMVDDIIEGKKPGTVIFHGARRFMRMALKLEKLADEQSRLKRQISEEEFNLQAILSSMVEGVMVVDNNHVIRLVNASFIKLFNIRNSPIRQTALSVVRDASVEEILRATTQTGETQWREVSLLSGGDVSMPRYFAVSSVPIIRPDGKISGMVTVFHDISRLRQLEDIRREFVANVSHELRTPLSIFHGYLENLLDAPDMPIDDRMPIYEIMQRHSRRLNALLEDLLTIARLESRCVKLEITGLDLAAFLAQFCKGWLMKAEKKNIALHIEVDATLPRLPVDEFRLEQVLNNVLENALKYTSEGGCIRLSAREGNQDDIEMRIEDNGTGIPLSDLPHIFERFYRVEKARSREKGGTGLGLSIVKHIMVLHGGTVEAQGALGKGTVIILRFPINRKTQTLV
ncbi:MAG: ATP-binding protein [Chthoniobacteraceae bacterium]